MTVKDFYSELHQRKFSAVYFFYGDEDFLIDEAVESILDEVLKNSDRDFNLDILFAGEVEATEVVAQANAFPMMTERRVIILRDFERLEEKDLVYAYVERPSGSTALVLISKKADSAISKSATIVEFVRLRDYELPRWVSERAASYDKGISPEASEVLVAYVGNSLRALDNEIEKIATFVGEKRTIDADDVVAVVAVSRTYNVFEMTRAVGNRDLPRSLKIIERMMELGETPVLMVAMITKHFMSLLKFAYGRKKKMSESELSSVLRARPSRLKEFDAHLRQFSPSKLERCFAPLARADEKLKFTSEDPRTVMAVLLHELLQ